MRGFGLHGDLDSNSLTTGLNFTQGGVLVGIDHKFSETTFAGLTAGYHSTDANGLESVTFGTAP